MQKEYLHHQKLTNRNTHTKIISEAQHVSKKQVVDINKLLNRVKISQR